MFLLAYTDKKPHDASMKIGIALSGGAAFGLANVGVLEALEAHGVRPDCLAGSSMGAIVGALAATGHNASVCRSIIGGLRMTSAFGRAPTDTNLLQHRLQELLGPYVGEATVGDCRIPFVCVAGRIVKPFSWSHMLWNGSTELFHECVETYVFPPETRLLDAVAASAAVPKIFPPVRIGQDMFMDLLHFGAIPTRELRAAHNPDVLIATDTMPRFTQKYRALLFAGPRRFMRDCWASAEEQTAAADYVIRPRLRGIHWRFDRGLLLADAGKAATEAAWPEIERILNS